MNRRRRLVPDRIITLAIWLAPVSVVMAIVAVFLALES